MYVCDILVSRHPFSYPLVDYFGTHHHPLGRLQVNLLYMIFISWFQTTFFFVRLFVIDPSDRSHVQRFLTCFTLGLSFEPKVFKLDLRNIEYTSRQNSSCSSGIVDLMFNFEGFLKRDGSPHMNKTFDYCNPLTRTPATMLERVRVLGAKTTHSWKTLHNET